MVGRAGRRYHPHGEQPVRGRGHPTPVVQRAQRPVLHRDGRAGRRDEPEVQAVPGGHVRDGSAGRSAGQLRRGDRVRTAQQPAEQVRRHVVVEGQSIFAGQREDTAARLCAEEHAVVLRGGHLRRQGLEADAEFGQDAVQEHEYR